MFSFHTDTHRYFDLQVGVTRQYLLPFVRSYLANKKRPWVLDIGSDIGATLKVFSAIGCVCVGVEIQPVQVGLANGFLTMEIAAGSVRLIQKNIFDVTDTEFGAGFDLIILKDVIEHIHDQPRLLRRLHGLLNPGGIVFLAFPPWQMPFGGHQQICSNKLLSRLPYVHLLPRPMYRRLLSWTRQPADILLEIRDTRLSIERFEEMADSQRYGILQKTSYLINPVYESKFGLKTRIQFPIIAGMPWIRNFFTTCMYYILAPVPDQVMIPQNNQQPEKDK